jgi:hypothetical protein
MGFTEEATMTKPMLVVLVLCSIAVAGCAQSSSAPAVTGPPANVTGVWTGSVGTGGTFIPVTLTLNQSGTSVKGDVSVGGRPDLSGPVKGSVQGDTLKGYTGAGPLSLRRSR